MAWESVRGTAEKPGSKLGLLPLTGSAKSEKPSWGCRMCRKAEAGRARGPHCKQRVAGRHRLESRVPGTGKPSASQQAPEHSREKNEVTRAHIWAETQVEKE